MPFGDTPAFDRGIDRGVMMPVGELITSALSNKGNATGFGQDNTFRVRDAEEVRIVDNKGQVLFSGTGPDAARQAVAIGQSITDEKGNKAGWTIQAGERTLNTDGSVGPTRYYDVANEKVNKNVLGQIADVALPIAGTLLAGPLGLGALGLGAAGTAAAGAAIGSGISSAAQGRSLEDSLLRAAIAGGGSYLGGQLFGPASPTTTAPTGGINADLIPNALEGLSFGSLTGASIPAGVGGAAGDIIVNAARAAAPNILGSTVGGVAGSSIPSLVGTSPPTPDEIVVTGNRPVAPSVEGSLGSIGSLIDPLPSMPDEIVVTGSRPTEGNLGSTAGSVVGALTPTLLDPTLLAPTPTVTAAPSTNDGVLGTGLNLPQLISIGGIGADLLQSLLAGGGDTGAGTPYVSPFGTGVGFARGQDMRANPNITDYERYGFGPEAMFFRPEYSGLLSSAAPAPQAQPAMAINPVYQPLI
jgi:hypothetical protein